MAIFKTEYGNFGNPGDLLRYMIEEDIQVVHVTTSFCGDTIGLEDFEMNRSMVEDWIIMGDET